MRYQLIWQVGLIIFVLGIMSIGLGAKGCSSADTSDLITGSSGYITQPSPIPDCILGPSQAPGQDPSVEPLWYGWTLTTGDFNGDGLDDLAVATESTYYASKVSVHYGSTSGFSTTPSWIGESNQYVSSYGYSLTNGDFNNDGFDDLVVGADKDSNGETDEGMVFVYHGSASGLLATPSWTAGSTQAGAWYGASVRAGNFDGDNFDDLMVESHYTKEQLSIYHGLTTGLSATAKLTIASFGGSSGDINNDGFDDLVGGVRVSPSVSMLFVCYGSASGLSTPSNLLISYQESRLISPCGLYDFNNDGFKDLIVTAPSATNDQGQEGKVWIHYGSASGFSTIFSWTGESNQSASGYGVPAAGDFNGDGLADLAIGANSYNVEGERGVGRVFIYYDVVGE